jgi:hypothetical protein
MRSGEAPGARGGSDASAGMASLHRRFLAAAAYSPSGPRMKTSTVARLVERLPSFMCSASHKSLTCSNEPWT